MMRRTKFTVAATAAALLVAGGVSYASVPDAGDGNLHACTVTSDAQALKPVYTYDAAQTGGYTSCPSGYTETELPVGDKYSLGKELVTHTETVSLDPGEVYNGESHPQAITLVAHGEEATVTVDCPPGKTYWQGRGSTTSGFPAGKLQQMGDSAFDPMSDSNSVKFYNGDIGTDTTAPYDGGSVITGDITVKVICVNK